jgi:hypothetical protein
MSPRQPAAAAAVVVLYCDLVDQNPIRVPLCLRPWLGSVLDNESSLLIEEIY